MCQTIPIQLISNLPSLIFCAALRVSLAVDGAGNLIDTTLAAFGFTVDGVGILVDAAFGFTEQIFLPLLPIWAVVTGYIGNSIHKLGETLLVISNKLGSNE